MYDVGTWVKVARNDYAGYTGYIVKVHPYLKQYMVWITLDDEGSTVPNGDIQLGLFDWEVYKADLEAGFDTSFLKDLAVDWSLITWNEELFNETMGVNEIER